MEPIKSGRKNQIAAAFDSLEMLARQQPFSTLKCDLCGLPAFLKGIENVPEWVRDSIKHENVIIPNPLAMCGECSAILCHQCSKSGRCSVCSSPYLLLGDCPEMPPTSPEARIKWKRIYELEYGIKPNIDLEENVLKNSKSSITDSYIKKPIAAKNENVISPASKVLINLMFIIIFFSFLQELFALISATQSLGIVALVCFFVCIVIPPILYRITQKDKFISKSIVIIGLFGVIIVTSPWITGCATAGHKWITPLSWIAFTFQILYFINFSACLSSKKLLNHLANLRNNRNRQF